MEVWNGKKKICFLSHCIMPTQTQTLRKAQLDASYVFGRGARVYLALLFYLLSLKSLSSKRLQATLK